MENLTKSVLVFDLPISWDTKLRIDTMHTYTRLKAGAYTNAADDASRRLQNFICNHPLTVTERKRIIIEE